jgi:DNA-binding transcriptional ArsR family regulator
MMGKIVETALEQKNEKILVSELMSRFGLARSSVYNKLKKLSIRPFTGEDGRKYVTLEQLELLKELDNFLKKKRGNTKDFVWLYVEKRKILPSKDTLSIEEEELLVALYEATEDFTPEQKQLLAQHRAECDRARKAREAAHNVNNFLSKALSGLTVLPNFNSNPSTSPSEFINKIITTSS